MAGSENEQTSFGQLIADGALEIGDGYRAKNEELGGNGIIFLRAGHVTDTHIDFVGVERFHSELESRVRSKLSQAGDAVVTTKGNSTGRTAYVTASMPPFVYSPHLSYWRSKDRNRIEGGFLRYWSKSQEFVEQLAGMKASTDMAPYLSLIDQKRLKISLPPIHQQRRIAHILGTLDDKIELNRRMNETLNGMAELLFASWIEGHATDIRESAVEDLINEQVILIGDGYRAKNSEFGPDGLPFMRAGNLKAEGLDLEGAEILSARSAEAAGSKVGKAGDVAFTSKGTVGRITRVSSKVGPFVYSPQVCFWRSLALEKLSPSVLYRWMLTNDFARQVAAVSGQTDMAPYVSLRDQRKMVIRLPSAALQQEMAGILWPIDERIALNTEQCRILGAIRDSLLPRLLNAEVTCS